MSLAAVVVRYRGGAEVERCLSSLLAHGGAGLDQVVLVDSGSGDGGAERLAAGFPEVEVLGLAENRSFAWAANQGVAATSAEAVLLLNPDTEVAEGNVESLVRALAARPTAAGVVPLLCHPDGRPQHRWQLRELPTWGRLATGRPGAARAAQVPGEPVAVAQPAAAAWLVRRPVWEALDGLDPHYAPAWWEDVDFCARLASRLGEAEFPAEQGFWLEPGARVTHLGGSSVPSLGQGAFLTAFHRNLLRYARRHHPGRSGLIAAGVRASLLLKAMTRPHRAKAYLEAVRAL